MTEKIQKVFDQATAEELTPLLDEFIQVEGPDRVTAARIARLVKAKIKKEKVRRHSWI